MIASRSRIVCGLLPRQLRSIDGALSREKKPDVFSTQTQPLPIDSIYTYTWLQNASPISEITPFGPLYKIPKSSLNKKTCHGKIIYLYFYVTNIKNMKKILLVLLCLPLLAFTQNGGQKAENESLRLEITGRVGSKTIIKVTNKQTCTTDMKFYHDGVTDTKTFAALASDTFQITLSDCSIKAKPTTNCGGANMGWVEWNVCVALPITFEWIITTQIDKNTIEVKFLPTQVIGKEFYIQLSTDGLNFKRVAIILPEDVKAGQIYSTQIKL